MVHRIMGLLMVSGVILTGGLTNTLHTLELTPPRVVVRHGGSVSAKCSTTATDHEGMGWEASQGNASYINDVNTITWAVENLTDWHTEPKCFMTLPDGEQPLVILPVTLYKPPDRVSISPLSHSGPVVEGTEYQLQCDVLNVAPVQNLTVIWYKGSVTMKTDPYRDQNKTPVNKSSILTITPSRADDGAQFRCEAQLNLGPEGPHPPPVVTSQPQKMVVFYPPVFSIISETFEYRRDNEVTLNCTAAGNPAPVYSWQSPQPQEIKEDQPIFTSFLLHPGTYRCTATNQFGEQTKLFFIKQKKDRTTFWAIIGSFSGLALLIVITYIVITCKASKDSII